MRTRVESRPPSWRCELCRPLPTRPPRKHVRGPGAPRSAMIQTMTRRPGERRPCPAAGGCFTITTLRAVWGSDPHRGPDAEADEDVAHSMGR
jgi:hypothetical protein